MARSAHLAFIVLVIVAPQILADDDDVAAKRIRSAVSRAIPLLEQGAAGSAKAKTCFTCHNQAMPVIALSAARQRGFAIDEENFKRQLDHTSKHLARGRENYLKGKGQGGRVVTAGYALWALEAGDYTPDETTTAVTGFLLQYQKKMKHWRQTSKRPPTSGSDFTATYVALRALAEFGSAQQEDQIATRKKAVRKWLLDAKTKDTEDQVFRLRSLKYAEADEMVKQQTKKLLEIQQEDGGWAQTPKLSSDAYATASVLAALLESGSLDRQDKAITRGIDYLLEHQLDDGSWRVATRADGFQEYFESGFPHGEDQFISIAASSWATLALTMVLPAEDSR